MPAGKNFKKYEWWFLVGLVIVLLATFAIAPVLRGTDASRHERPYTGTFQVLPNKRESLDESEVERDVLDTQAFMHRAMQTPSTSIRYSQEWSGLRGEDGMETAAAGLTHHVQRRSAEEAGYRVGDDELRQALRRFLGPNVTPEVYARALEQIGFPSKAAFEQHVREIALRDKFLTPLIDSMRWSQSRAEAFKSWKSSRERVDLAFAAVPAAQFADAVAKEEETRSTLAVEAKRFSALVEATQAIRTTVELAQKHKEKNGAWPADAKALEAGVTGAALPKDPWGKPLSYRVEGDAAVVSSAGPDGVEGNADDVTPAVADVLKSLAALRQVGDGLRVWHGSVKSWPTELAKLASPPPVAAGSPPLPAPLTAVPKDAWGKDLAWDSAAGRLSSTGPDGAAGTPDDLVADVTETAVGVPVPALLDAWRTAGAKDAWGRPLRARFAGAVPPRLEATSDGPDGVAGNDDDVVTDNASDLAAWWASAKGQFREPDRRGFEAIHVQLPLVPDDVMREAWAKFEKYRPDEAQAHDRFTTHKGDPAKPDYYTVSENVEVEGKTVPKDVDPADPVKGHGLNVLKDLKSDKASPPLPADAKGWLVPAPDVFGAQKDPPAPAAGVTPDPLWTEKGWRRVLLREMWFENLLNTSLKEIREAQAAQRKWAADKSDKKGEEPKVPTFQDVLARFRDVAPGEADRAAGGRFLEFLSREPLSREELEAIPEIGEANATAFLRTLKEPGDVSPIPVVIKGSNARVIFRLTKFVASHDPELEAVREKAWPKWLEHRAMERAAKEAQRIQEEAQKKTEGEAKAPTLEEAAAKVAAARGFRVHTGTTGLFVGATSAARGARPMPADATPERRDELRRRAYVRRAGYGTVSTMAPQGQAAPSVKVGTFGRRVQRDESTGEDATRTAYLVQVRDQRDPSPREFHAEAWSRWLSDHAHEASGRGGRGRQRAIPVRSRSGYLDTQISRYLDDWESVKTLWGIQLDHPEIVKPRETPGRS